MFRLIDFDAPSKRPEFSKIEDLLAEALGLCERGATPCTPEEFNGIE